MNVAWSELTRCNPRTDMYGADTFLLGIDSRRKCNNGISTKHVYSGQAAAYQTVTLFDVDVYWTGICSVLSAGRQQRAYVVTGQL